jgi:hypothetical protein
MNDSSEVKHGIYESSNDIIIKAELRYLKFSKKKEIYIVTLIDDNDFNILRGFGKYPIEAMNDLHHNLI